MASDLVSDTGIEPVTSSVSGNDPGVVTCIDTCLELLERSANIHDRLALLPRVVTQLDTQPLTMP
jgi:hypothetical protein